MCRMHYFACEAVRKLMSLPAENFTLEKRWALKVGHLVDVAVFDPETECDSKYLFRICFVVF